MTRPADERSARAGTDALVADYERLIEELNNVYSRVKNELIPRVTQLAIVTNPVLIPWREAIAEKVNRTLQLLAELDQRIVVLLLSWTLPLRLWRTTSEWIPVRAMVSGVAGDLGVTNREVFIRWKGVAADTYDALIPAHLGAAGRLASVADTVQFALNQAASAIAHMYAAVLGLIVGFFGAAMVALATAATGVGVPIAVVIMLILVGTVLTIMSSIFTSSAQALGTARTWLTELLSEMQDNTAFPGGHWPAARPELLSDASGADGDPSDWTVRA
jgi:hypothetical protein